MLLLAIACSAPDPAPAPVETAHAVFGEDRVHAASLVVADADWEALRTLAATRGSIRKTWFEADLEWDGEPVGRVGIRVKGQSKRLEAVGESIPLKVDFDRFTEGLRIHGLEGLALHSTPVDPTGIREALAYAAWREAGVPTARTGFVALTVNGRALGTYVSVESLDEHWLAATFPPGDGVLYEPVGTLGPPLTAR
ncbi:MAG: CotH kinase family protein, partial [Myxococcales bacterium]|nr:CotH kinase family protein [Myxococcales bacterium]